MAYTPYSYGSMLLDRVRTDAYIEALRLAVKPGMTVVDLGAGTGYFAIIACQLGATHVHAIDYNDSIVLGAAMAKEAGFADRITFHHAKSGAVKLPERVDLVMHDIRSTLPPCRDNLAVVADARNRFLKPGGTMIPLRDDLFVTLVHAPELHRRHVRPWTAVSPDLEFADWASHNASTHFMRHIDSADFAVTPQLLVTLDWTKTQGEVFDERRTFSIEREQTLHGIYIWFRSHLTESVHYDSGTADESRVYGYSYFPWPEETAVEVGDEVECRIAIRSVADRYIWIWQTVIVGVDGKRKQRFEQSDFHSWALRPQHLKPIRENTPLTLTEAQRMTHFVLQQLSDGRTVGEVAELMVAEDTFPVYSSDAARDVVRNVLRRNER